MRLPFRCCQRRRSRRMKRLIILFLLMYSVVLLFLHGAMLGSISLCALFDFSCSITSDDLWILMESNKMFPNSSNETVMSPLSRMYLKNSNALHFFDLPKLKTSLIYGEITTANRNSRYRLAPDFTFHISYENNSVVLYEDYGPGCIFRIYLYPALSTDSSILYKLTVDDLHSLALNLKIDGVSFTYPLDKVMQGIEAPFIWPLSTRHKKPSSGMGAYTPICYQESLVVSYIHDKPFIPNLLEHTVNCTLNELKCDTKIYSAISRHKYPYGVKMNPYRQTTNELSDIKTVARTLSWPEYYGPGSSDNCILSCAEVCVGCQRVLYHSIHTSGVLSAIKFRLFDGEDMRGDWMDFLLSVYIDDSLSPLVDHIPLGSLFGAAGSLHDHQGAVFGRRHMKCRYEPGFQDLPRRVTTGYLFLPMPFWTELLVVVERSKTSIGDPKLCYQLTVVSNNYDMKDTGYLNIRKTYYGEDVGRWREVVNIKGGVGHIVGVGVEIDNLKAKRDVPLAHRWAALQADPVIYVDGAPAVLGTGLEDYFSYSHGFTGAENVTYAFVGLPHAGQPPSRLEPLSWHCYRQHVVDPVIFTKSLHFIMEGTDEKSASERAPTLDYYEHEKRKRANSTTFAYIVYYYLLHSNRSASENNCDSIYMGRVQSEQKHKLKLNGNKINDNIFHVTNKKFIGDSLNTTTFTGSGRGFVKDDNFSFVMTLGAKRSHNTILLRRVYHLNAWQWNSKALISLNNARPVTWFIPMGTLDREYSIGQDQISFYIGNEDHIDRETVKFMFTVSPLTEWRDISYELCYV